MCVADRHDMTLVGVKPQYNHRASVRKPGNMCVIERHDMI